MDKVCDTCLYGYRADDNKLGCRYPGICHTPDGEKTAWAPKKAQCENVHVLTELKKLADGMYRAAQYLTTDASHLRKAMDEYRQFIIQNKI